MTNKGPLFAAVLSLALASCTPSDSKQNVPQPGSQQVLQQSLEAISQSQKKVKDVVDEESIEQYPDYALVLYNELLPQKKINPSEISDPRINFSRVSSLLNPSKSLETLVAKLNGELDRFAATWPFGVNTARYKVTHLEEANTNPAFMAADDQGQFIPLYLVGEIRWNTEISFLHENNKIRVRKSTILLGHTPVSQKWEEENGRKSLHMQQYPIYIAIGQKMSIADRYPELVSSMLAEYAHSRLVLAKFAYLKRYYEQGHRMGDPNDIQMKEHLLQVEEGAVHSSILIYLSSHSNFLKAPENLRTRYYQFEKYRFVNPYFEAINGMPENATSKLSAFWIPISAFINLMEMKIPMDPLLSGEKGMHEYADSFLRINKP